MRAWMEVSVALSLALMACGGSGSSGGGNGGTANGGAGGAGTGAHHAGGHGAHNQTGGASANGGASASGGSAHGGSGTTSGVGGGGACDAAGTCGDEDGGLGCGHCALDDSSMPPGPCASLIDTCVNDNQGTDNCEKYAICCMGHFPCDPSCKTQFPMGAAKFKPIDMCVCSKCVQSCQSECQ